MKKNFLKVMAVVLGTTFLMAGCATVSDVKIDGKEPNFKEPVYNQGQVLVVGDYLYFGNGYTASDSEGFNYKNAAKNGYMARLDLSKGLIIEPAKGEDEQYTSPSKIDKVVKDKLVGYQAQDMFAYGKYIYFTSANTHKSSSLENDYTQVSLFRVKYNGDDFKELVKNSAFKQGEGSTITVQKGSDKNYYYIIVEPSSNNMFTIKSLKIGDKLGKIKKIAEDVTSYAIADEESSERNIIYTTASKQAQTTTAVKAVDFATGKTTDLDNGVTGSSAIMLGRVGDGVFYSYKNSNNKVNEVYYKDMSSGGSYFGSSMKSFYNATTIKNIKRAGNGFIFTTDSGSLMYKEFNSSTDLLMTSEEFSDILFVEEDYIYTSTDKSIKRISTFDKEVEEILALENETIISGQCGYDGQYIYYYQNLLSSLFEDENGKSTKSDENYYLFRTDKLGNRQIIGKRAKI